ncbi:MAG: UvrD-helicase domain-containing protein [Defluviitaleaceae bacterium]|nr:UvrD-helicase domain-containing protein [Defluviitaleaceae bacterium]
MNLDHLNDEQREAVLQTDGVQLLLLAGAGSGKTGVITHRIAHLIEKGVAPWKILAVTFTNKAAKEMKERVETLIGTGGKKPTISTFHSLCSRILRAHISNLEGFDSNFAIYDTSDAEKVIKEVIRDLNLSEKMYPYRTVQSKISNLKDSLIYPEDYEKNTETEFREKKIASIYAEYQKRLTLNNALDFDDLLFKTIEIFQKNKEILANYQNLYEYIMIDEYQDTNHSQYILVKMLAEVHKNICVVGDDDQSIYGWRGADITNILDFEKDYENAITIKLEQNYRSTANILNAANEVIKNNLTRKSKILRTDKGDGEKITFIKNDEDYGEARQIADIILNKNDYKNTAILYRQNSLSRIMEESLVRQNIPYKIFGGARFYDRKEIKDILAYLKVLYNNQDQISLRRIINVPRRGIGNSTIEKVVKYSVEQEAQLYNTLENIENLSPLIDIKPKKLKEFYEMMEEFKKFANANTVSNLITHILEKIDYKKELGEDKDEVNNRMDNIKELVSKAVEWQETAEDTSLSAFLQEVALISDFDTSNDDKYVSLMTLHTAKGLEFNTVFIIGFDEGVFPSYRSISSEAAMEEERRLCYVGITRAKEKLYLSSANSRIKNGKAEYFQPSRFLKEINKDLIEFMGKIPETKGVSQFAGGKQFTGDPSREIGKSYKNPIPAPKNKTLGYNTGEKVNHSKYGDGIIIAINPAGADFELTIEFKNNQKKFMAGLVKLKKI